MEDKDAGSDGVGNDDSDEVDDVISSAAVDDVGSEDVGFFDFLGILNSFKEAFFVVATASISCFAFKKWKLFQRDL